MKGIRTVLLGCLILMYSITFFIQEKNEVARIMILQPAMPVSFYTIVSGYLRQLAAETLFIRTSVFLGGISSETQESSFEHALGQNFDVMTKLYPRFIDPYYFCQGFLSHISREAAAKSNSVLETGIAAYPEDKALRFFYASNFFLNMDEPLKGAQAFAEATKIADAPPLFGHLAALLSAEGGDIEAGLITLRVLLSGEKDETVRKRYLEEIVIFEQANTVSQSLKAYTAQYGTAPSSLEQLVPDFLSQLPEIHGSFVLVYDPPNLHLQRPDRRKNAGKGVPWQ